MLKFFGKADTLIEVGLRWWAVFGITWGGLSWLASKMTWLSDLNWAELLVVGLSGAMLLSVVTSFALISIRFFRPPTEPASKLGNAPFVGHDESRSTEALHITIERLELSFKRHEGELRKLAESQESILTESQRLTVSEVRLDERIEAVRVDTSINGTSIAKLATKVDDEIMQRRSSLNAVYTRELLTNIADDIEKCASKLYDELNSGEIYSLEKWAEWEITNKQWEGRLNDWVERGQWYAHDVVGRVWRVADEDYGGSWPVSDDQLPSSEAMRRFKRHRIIHGQWRQTRPVVDLGVTQVAFMGLTEKQVQERRVPG